MSPRVRTFKILDRVKELVTIQFYSEPILLFKAVNQDQAQVVTGWIAYIHTYINL